MSHVSQMTQVTRLLLANIFLKDPHTFLATSNWPTVWQLLLFIQIKSNDTCAKPKMCHSNRHKLNRQPIRDKGNARSICGHTEPSMKIDDSRDSNWSSNKTGICFRKKNEWLFTSTYLDIIKVRKKLWASSSNHNWILPFPVNTLDSRKA